MSAPAPVAPLKLQTFHAACWVLGLVAFLELVAVGVALALQNGQENQPQVVERVEYRTLGATPSSEPPLAGPDVPLIPSAAPTSPVPVAPAPVHVPEAAAPTVSLKTPPIADPIVERYVAEAREARVAGDIRQAIVKLVEAEKRAPNEPNMLYQSGQVFEAAGIYDKATDYYQKVFELGTAGAGSLYELAAHKIAHGFVGVDEMRGKLTLGRVRQFNDPRVQDGQKVIITVPVLAVPDDEFVPENIMVSVSFFDKLQGEVVPAAKRNEPKEEGIKWVTEPVDWLDPSGEELLQVTYFIPEGAQQDLHLFGQREHFGQLVELTYGEELVDRVAWPRILARRVSVPEADMLILPEEFMPEGLNPDNPLLPPLPRK